MTWLLFAISSANYLDRQIFALLQEAIRTDLLLTDFQMSLVSGIGFAAFYALGSLPTAVLVGERRRNAIIGITAIAWGVMASYGAIASGMLGLFISRSGVGFFEAAGTPAAHAALTAQQAGDRTIRSLGLFFAGAPMGAILAFSIAGGIAPEFGWRAAMFVAGIPAVLAGLAFLLLVPRAASNANLTERPEDTANGHWNTVQLLFRNPVTRYIICGETFLQILMASSVAWFPTFQVREHGFSQTQVAGIALAGAVLTIAGTIGSAHVTAHFGKRHHAWNAWVPAIAILLVRPFAFVFLLSSSAPLVTLSYMALASLAVATYAPTVAILHGAVPAPHRRVASAVLMTTITVIGPLVGNLLVGLLSDGIFNGDSGGLRYALVCMQLFSLIAAAFYIIAGLKMAKSEPASKFNRN